MQETSVVVVGAGAAGIAASRLLLARGCRALLVEARPRLGGRACTIQLRPGLPFDAGASYLHAADRGNPWVELAAAHGVELRPDPRRRVSPGGDLAALQAGLAALASRAGQARPEATLAEAIAHDAPPHAELLRFAGQWVSGVDAELVDARDFAATVTGEDRLAPAGYGALVAAVAHGLPARTGTPVRSVRQRPGGVDVQTDDGTLRAGLAIVAVPTGVLARGDIALPLPAAHRQALAALPMGRLVKVAIELDGDPFGHGDGWYLHGPAAVRSGFLHAVRHHGFPLSTAFVGGSAAHALDRPELIAEAARDSLRQAFGSGVAARLGRIEVADWWHDPWARGSYAVPVPGGAWARAVLRTPLAERVLYAGEAAADDGWAGTVAGAWLDGRRAALAALDILSRTGD